MRGLPATADKEVVRLPPPQREGLHLLGLGAACPSEGGGTWTWDIEYVWGVRLSVQCLFVSVYTLGECRVFGCAYGVGMHVCVRVCLFVCVYMSGWVLDSTSLGTSQAL